MPEHAGEVLRAQSKGSRKARRRRRRLGAPSRVAVLAAPVRGSDRCSLRQAREHHGASPTRFGRVFARRGAQDRQPASGRGAWLFGAARRGGRSQPRRTDRDARYLRLCRRLGELNACDLGGIPRSHREHRDLCDRLSRWRCVRADREPAGEVASMGLVDPMRRRLLRVLTVDDVERISKPS